MSRTLLKNIEELFPSLTCKFPSVDKILETPDDYGLGFYTNNPRPFAFQLINNGFILPHAEKYWKNQIIVDLGCGRQNYVYAVSCIGNARAYVPVDKYHIPRWTQKFIQGEEWKTSLEDFEKESKVEYNRVPVYPIYGDMFNLLELLPNDSVGILIAGIDRTIVGENEKT
jgi:hypothetical protein